MSRRWNVRRSWPHAPEDMDEAAALDELRASLADSVRSQLVADVPVGVFLSGGVDSSTVAAFAARRSIQATRRARTADIAGWLVWSPGALRRRAPKRRSVEPA